MAPDGQNLDRILGSMADAGMKGQMYSRDDLMNKQMGEMGMADGGDPGDFAQNYGGAGGKQEL